MSARETRREIERSQYQLDQLEVAIAEAERVYQAELIKSPTAPAPSQRYDEAAIAEARRRLRELITQHQVFTDRVSMLMTQLPAPEAVARAPRPRRSRRRPGIATGGY